MNSSQLIFERTVGSLQRVERSIPKADKKPIAVITIIAIETAIPTIARITP